MTKEKMSDADRVLTELLAEKLPRFAAPASLHQRLAAVWPVQRSAGRAFRRLVGPVLGAAAACIIAIVTMLVVQADARRRTVLNEAVNDHLRALEGAQLAAITGGLHEVKPWFAGKLDFAPAVPFAGDDDFPLQGGAVERFLDRRAAVFVYKRRLHTISLFVVRAESLNFSPLGDLAAWPAAGEHVETMRGFNVILWRLADQGFALVSDVNPSELAELQRRISAPAAR